MEQVGTTERRSDVIVFLRSQHTLLRELLGAVLVVRGEDRGQAFARLRRTLAVHEAAEQAMLHPLARRTLPRGGSIVAARVAEEEATKSAIAALERLNVDSAEFEAGFHVAEATVLRHIQAEEREEFSILAGRSDGAPPGRMRELAELAETIAPKRLREGIAPRIANALAGPFDVMVERAREALSKG